MTDPIDPELLAKLKALGIDPTSDKPQWVDLPSVEAKDLESVQKTRELLGKIKDGLKSQLENDLSQLEALRIERERLKNGGGS